MTLVRRLWLWGAAVPLLVVIVVMCSAAFVFRGMLIHGVDRALLNQAAIESVSLFDGPTGEPHLHLEKSPLEAEIRTLAAITWLFDQEGQLFGVYPKETDFTMQPVPFLPTSPSGPSTVRLGDVAFRVYTIPVYARDGRRLALQLASSLAPVEAATRAFVLIALGVAALLGVFLLTLQGWQAHVLSGRLLDIRHRLAALREGRVLPAPEGPNPGDEIAEVQDALTRTAARLQEVNAAQEHLVARAAHELRTPLALMRTTLDLALRRERSAEELRQALVETRREVDRLAAVAATLLELSAPQDPPDQQEAPNADVREVLEEAVKAAQAAADQRDVQIILEGPPNAPARLDALGVRRAADNLISNALRFAPPQSPVRVQLSVGPTGGYLIAVEDEGPGIPADRRDDVFRPFVRIEKDGGGAGLGLALVREVAQRHGGTARIVDGARGARVEMELPLAGP